MMNRIGTMEMRLVKLFIAVMVFSTTFAVAQETPDSVQAENAFFRGSHLLTRDSLSEAVSVLEKAVKLDPENPKYKNVLAVAYNNLGIKLNKEGDYKDGMAYLSKAMTVASEDKEIRQNYMQSAFEAVGAPDDKFSPDDKILLLNEILDQEPDNETAKKSLAALLNNSAVVKGRSGDYEEEVARLEKAIATEPGNPKIKKNLSTAYFNLSTAKSKAGEYEEEIRLLKAAQNIAPKDSIIIQHMGRAFSNLASKQGDVSAQIELLKQSLEIFPGDGVTKSNLAAAYNNAAVSDTKMSAEERVAYLENALKLDPKNQTTTANLAGLLVREAIKDANEGQINQAIEILEKVLKIDPGNKASQKNLAAIYHNEALEMELLQKALNFAPSNPEIKADLATAYNDFALALGKKGDSKQELLYLTKAAKLVPDNKIIQDNLAKVKQKNAKEEKKETLAQKKKTKDS
jgi:tetratricopeptide (TPR) repeat protein